MQDGLVFGYDADDRSTRFYPGEPTTNLAASGGLSGMSGVSLTDLGLDDGWRKYSISGTFNGGTYPYTMLISGYSFTGGVSYSSRCVVKTNVGSKFNYFGTSGISYVNAAMDNQGTLSSILNADGSRTVARTGFAYTSTTSQTGYLWTNPVNGTVFSSSTDFVWIKDLQVEQNAHVTQFTSSSRSATQGLIDLKNTTSIDLSNASFDSTAHLTFDGTDDYIDLNNAVLVGPGQGTFTCWVKLAASNVNHAGIFTSQTGASWAAMRFVINIYTPNKIRFVISDGSSATTNGCVSNTALSYGEWYHVACTYDGTSMKIYLNGVLDDTFNTTKVPGTYTPSATMVGSQNHGNRYLNGGINIVKIYNKALSQAEVEQNFSANKSRFNL